MATLAESRKNNKRSVQPIERFTTKDYEKELIEGEGIALGDIPEIKTTFKSMKRVSDMAEFVHLVLYGTKGQQDMRKKQIMAFKGIKGKDEEETKEILERKKKYLEKQRFANLVELCRLFCLAGAAKEKTKEKYAEEIVNFLEKPNKDHIVVTEKEKVVQIEEEEEEVEEPTPKRKPTTRAKKAETKKEVKKPAKKTTKKETKATPKKGGKKEDKKATPKKTAAKKAETKKAKTTTPKKTTKKTEEKADKKKPVKKTEKKEKETKKPAPKKEAKK